MDRPAIVCYHPMHETLACECNIMKEFWFSYIIFENSRLVRIGKGNCNRKSADKVRSYLRGRYLRYCGRKRYSFSFTWHFSEAAAFKNETRMIDDYMSINGTLPLWNRVRGGGGGQAYVKCRAYKTNGDICRNDAIVGYYGYCGIHY